MDVNKKVLLIDDQKEILESMRKLLSGEETLRSINNKLDSLLNEFFDEKIERNEEEIYDVYTASSGEEGFEILKRELENGEPFSVVTIDMRMPGWDGLRTAKEIRNIDPNIEIVIMTAYTDRNRIEIIKEVGKPEKFLYLKKPFEREEILQVLLSLTLKWSLEQKVKNQLLIIQNSKKSLEQVINGISEIEKINPLSINDIYRTILKELASIFKYNEGIVLFENDCIRLNQYSNFSDIEDYKTLRENGTEEKFYRNENYLIINFSCEEGSCALGSGIGVMKVEEELDAGNEKLLRIFISHANNLIRNSNLYTELREKNEALLESNRKLKEANELKRKFLVTSSHELRTPSSLLLAYSEMLQNENYPNKKKIIEKVSKASIRLKELIEKMFNSITTSEMKELVAYKEDFYVIDEIFSDVKIRLEVFLEKRNQTLTLVNNLERDYIYVDRKKIVDFVLFNLVINAIKFSEDEKNIVVQFDLSENHDKIIVSVIDEGLGVSQEEINKIFMPLYVGGEENKHHSGIYEYKSKGLGLGLTIAKNTITSMNQEIYCESNEGKGSKFIFTLDNVKKMLK